jgi:hypothetical protein
MKGCCNTAVLQRARTSLVVPCPEFSITTLAQPRGDLHNLRARVHCVCVQLAGKFMGIIRGPRAFVRQFWLWAVHGVTDWP